MKIDRAKALEILAAGRTILLGDGRIIARAEDLPTDAELAADRPSFVAPGGGMTAAQVTEIARTEATAAKDASLTVLDSAMTTAANPKTPRLNALESWRAAMAASGLQVGTATTNAAGTGVWAFPTPYPAGSLPVVVATIATGIAVDLVGVQITGVTNTGATFRVWRIGVVGQGQAAVLAINPNPGVISVNLLARLP